MTSSQLSTLRLDGGSPDRGPTARAVLVPDGRGGAGLFMPGLVLERGWHRLWAPGPGYDCGLSWVGHGLGLEQAGETLWLSESREDGQRPEVRLEAWGSLPHVHALISAGGTRLEIHMAPQPGEPAVVLRVRVHGGRAGARLRFRPAFTVPRPPGEAEPTVPSVVLTRESPHSRVVRISGESRGLEVLFPDGETVLGPHWVRGRRFGDFWYRPMDMAFPLPPGESTREFRVALEGVPFEEAGRVMELADLREAGLESGPAHALEAVRGLLDYPARGPGGEALLPDRLPFLQFEDPGAPLWALPALDQLESQRGFVEEVLLRYGQWLRTGEAALPICVGLEWLRAGMLCGARGRRTRWVRSELRPLWQEWLARLGRGELRGLAIRADGTLRDAGGFPADEEPAELQHPWSNRDRSALYLESLWRAVLGQLEALGPEAPEAGPRAAWADLRVGVDAAMASRWGKPGALAAAGPGNVLLALRLLGGNGPGVLEKALRVSTGNAGGEDRSMLGQWFLDRMGRSSEFGTRQPEPGKEIPFGHQPALHGGEASFACEAPHVWTDAEALPDF